MYSIPKFNSKIKYIGFIAAVVFMASIIPFNKGVAVDNRRLVSVFADGQTQTVSTRSSTVGEVIDRLEITIQENDLVEPSIDTEISEETFNINIYRAKLALVVDGDSKHKVLTARSSPRAIASEAGIETVPQDRLRIEPTENFLADGHVGAKVVIDRATKLQVNTFGTIQDLYTHETTVKRALDELGIDYSSADKVEPSLDTKVTEGLKIDLYKEFIETVKEEEIIKFSERTINDSSMDKGERDIIEKGKNGEREVTYEITRLNNKELERKKISEVIIKEPVEQVVKVGTKVSASAAPAANISGSKQDWMSAAGIPQSDWQYVDFIVTRESGWNPNAVNASSGACGLGQQLPCGKWDSYGAWNNPVAALTAQYAYVQGRYGSYAAAYSFWTANHWY